VRNLWESRESFWVGKSCVFILIILSEFFVEAMGWGESVLRACAREYIWGVRAAASEFWECIGDDDGSAVDEIFVWYGYGALRRVWLFMMGFIE
jgi:hypothetical protein